MPRRPDGLGAADTPPGGNGGARHAGGSTPIAFSTAGGRRSGCRSASSTAARSEPARGRRAGLPRDPRRLVLRRVAEAARLLRPQVEAALGELVTLGLVTSDSFAGLRALLTPSSQRKPRADARRRGRILPFEIESGGRWAVVRRDEAGRADRCRPRPSSMWRVPCLRRYGVVFWRLLAREARWLPPWRDLLRVYRRLEARGEIRGGRFVAGFSGEQYALPEAIGSLREIRRRPAADEWVSLSAPTRSISLAS